MSQLPLIRIDIISDVMCPWCIIGYKKLEQAMSNMTEKVQFNIYWQPFELNPEMPPEGQNLNHHLQEKYGFSKEQNIKNCQYITEIGNTLDFEFCYHKDSRIVNTFLAHQLLYWAKIQNKQTELKLTLFDGYFTRQQDPSDIDVLLEAAEQIGLNREDAKKILQSQCFAQNVRDEQNFWLQNEVRAVPAFIFNKQYLLSGAQEPETLQDVIETIIKEL
ncbi:DsbA family oxidoreductase [Psychromonas ossibalaenae]|uniref:DsbA family oxidoreductase n=1 Tax=Psychromonas ossibalaenae TaxID=444922 RepID=UPI00035DFD2B|nr:DsbA family oxidoreductase [Psychromonas ossibalaenae]